MSWLDEKYINMLSPRLERFRIISRNPYKANFRCPYCGDSARSKTRARGNIYPRGNKLLYGCFNCGKGRTVANFIKDNDPELFKQYSMEKFKKSKTEFDVEPEPIDLEKEFAKKPETDMSVVDELMDRVSTLPDDHFAVEYLLNRGITKSMLNDFYFIDSVEKIEQLSEKYKNKIHGKEPRVGLPYYNRQGRLVGFTFRALEDHPIKYLDIKFGTEESMLFNIDRVNLNEDVYALEGPIDSLFLPNAVAVGSSDLMKAVNHVPHEKCVFIFDNQPRNKQLLKLMRKAIEAGSKLFIWPKSLESGDINDLVKSGECSIDKLPNLINNNTYRGLSLQTKFNEWKRCTI